MIGAVTLYVSQNHISIMRTPDCEHHWLRLVAATAKKFTQIHGSTILVLFSALFCIQYH